MNKVLIKILKIVRVFILIGLCFIIILPLYKMFVDSVTLNKTLLIPDGLSLRSYYINIDQIISRKLLYNSLKLSLVCAIIEVIFASISGYAFAKMTGKIGNIFFYLYLFTCLIPYEILEAGYKYLFLNYPIFGIPLIGKRYSIYVFYIFGGGIKSPIFVYLFRSLYKNLDNEIIEQGNIDGCGNIKTFFKLVLPNSMPAIIPTFLLAFIWVYNDTQMADMFKVKYDDFELISVALSNNLIRRGGVPTAFIMILPLLIIYVCVERKFFEPFKLDITS